MLQVPDVTRMNDVEATVAEDHRLADALGGADDGDGLVRGDDLSQMVHADVDIGHWLRGARSFWRQELQA